ncbi:MAG TPA: cobyric acid synthase [Euryarchaeota archaeon]|nr:cobyric acid synthase [Euryarchaeota archaeon]
MKKALMVVGTSSFAGKTLIVAALCRIFRNAGLSVTPFKAQNMSLNSAVTADGREISRAQWLQALAAGVEATADMNPILLKPMGKGVSQVVLFGRPWGDICAGDYYRSFVAEKGRAAVREALGRLADRFDIIVLEGAGSPAEINLRDRDIANLWAADAADADVILVADIERGGVFASIYGTLSLLEPKYRKRVKGVIINKFRGDERLLESGISEIESLTGVPVLGVLPYIEGLRLPEEDSQGLRAKEADGRADVVVLRLPRISNFTDFDPLELDGRVSLRYITRPEELGNPDAIIIPGTKSTVDDLKWMQEQGFEIIRSFQGRIPIIGVCGGYQILGREIVEDDGPETHRALGLLDVDTSFESYNKKTVQASGTVDVDSGIFQRLRGATISGYEIHMGETQLGSGARKVFAEVGAGLGAADADYMTFGTYLHGLFDSPDFREAFISFIVKDPTNSKDCEGRGDVDMSEVWDHAISQAAETVKNRIDLSWFYEE